MGIYIGKSLTDEIRNCLMELGQANGSDKTSVDAIIEKLGYLIDKVTNLECAVKDVMDVLNKIDMNKSVDIEVAQKHNVNQLSNPVVAQSKPQVVQEEMASNAVSNNVSSEVIKLIYSGFQKNAFELNQKVGVGEQFLAGNPMANYIVECEKGVDTGYFYPNPSNIKALQFNVAYNLSPVCDIVSEGIPILNNIIEKGTVRLSPDKAWIVVTKCKVKL